MECSYGQNIDDTIIISNLNRLCSQTFSLLPMREEEKEWKKPIETISIELLGMNKLFPDNGNWLSLIAKLLGLLEKDKEEDFYLYRRTIFECCGMINKIKEQVQGGD